MTSRRTRRPDEPRGAEVDPEQLERLVDRFAPEHRRNDRSNPQNAHPRDHQEGTTS